MKYPANVDISLIIRYAMHIKSPQLYECPAGAFVQVTNAAELHRKNPDGGNASSPATVSNGTKVRSSTLPRQMPSQQSSSKSRQTQPNDTRNTRPLKKEHIQRHPQNYSVAESILQKQLADEQLQIRLNNIQNATALAAMRFNSTGANGASLGEHDPNIVEGFLENVCTFSLSRVWGGSLLYGNFENPFY